MDWLEVIISVAIADLETASAIANMTVPYGIFVEDYSDLEAGSYEVAHVDLIDESLIAKDRDKGLIHIYFPKDQPLHETIVYLRESLTAAHVDYLIKTADVAMIDWNEYWKQFFHTTKIGDRLLIQPVWEHADNPENRCVLKMDPGAAFGTGTHATTSLCLSVLDRTVRPGMNVLDIGCGSGVLGIASVLLGADRCLGVDIDANAVRIAGQNAALNGVTSCCAFLQGDLARQVSGQYEIVCANLVADVVIRLLDTVSRYMTDNGVLIASGILDTRIDDVRNAVQSSDLSIETELKKENWYALTIRKKEFLIHA